MAKNYLITGYWGEPHVTAENDRGIHAAAFGSGRFVLPVGEQFRAEYIGNNTIRMYDGKLMNNGAAAGIPAGEYVDLLISNAGQGMKRNDLIVFQYSQDVSTLIESGVFVVIQGTETSGTPSDPELTQNDLLLGGATFDQMALWRVTVSGTDIAEPERIYDIYSNKLNRWSYTAADDAEDLANVNAILDVLGDAENGGSAVGYAICNRQFNVDQTPMHAWLYRIESINRNYARIEATTSLDIGATMQRVRINGVWQPWEHLSPALYVGQEYRTTERWLGKPAYVKVIDFGKLPNNNTRTVAHNIANVGVVIDVFGQTSYASSLQYAGVTGVYGNKTNIAITTNADLSGISAYVAIKYTKTTD